MYCIPLHMHAHTGLSRDSMEDKMSVTLLYTNKSSCLDSAERVKVTSAINVHQLTIHHERLYHRLLLYLDRSGVVELWKLVFHSPLPPSQPGLHTGLLGVVLDNAVTVWMDGVPSLMEEQQEVQQVHTYQQQQVSNTTSCVETILGVCVWCVYDTVCEVCACVV